MMIIPILLAHLVVPHPGPPIFLEIEVEESAVRVVVTSEQEALLSWMGRETPIAEASANAGLERELAVEAARLLQEERGLDLAFDGVAVTYEVESVKLFDEFGVGNAEPSIQVELRVDSRGEAPSSIAVTWGLFERVEEEGKRVLPILVSADGEFDLLRANELEPTVTWESANTGGSNGAGRAAEILTPTLAVKGPPRIRGKDRTRMWRATRVVAYFLAGLSLLVCLRLKGWRARLLCMGAAVLLFFGARLIPSASDGERRLLPDEALALFGKLHESVYLSFGGRSEDEIYERLAVCVNGPLLDDLYSEILQGLVLEDDGGAICRVEEVEATDGTLVPLEEKEGFPAAKDSFGVDWTWRVRGRVIHYGHEHVRENRYRAHYRVSPVDGAWRITDVDVLEHERAELD